MINETENETWMDLSNQTGIDNFSMGVGIGYICTGVIFIFLQLACAYLITANKNMNNPTYKLMVNLSICDAMVLVSLGIYCGITILLDREQPTMSKWMADIALSGWYTNGLLFAFIAFSRWIAITKPHLVSSVFSKSVVIFLHTSAWVPVALASIYICVIHDPPLFVYYRQMFSCNCDVGTRMSEICDWIDFSMNTIIGFIEMSFNVMSMLYVHKTRKQVQTMVASANRRREVKLLIQCFIMGCVFAAASVMFTMAGLLGWTSRVAIVCTLGVWIFNHCVNPLVYLSVNTELRKKFWQFITFKRLPLQWLLLRGFSTGSY